MREIKKVLTVFVAFLLLNSCSNDDFMFTSEVGQGEVAEKASVERPAIIVFGHFYGKCEGVNCVEIFKLSGDVLLEDGTDQYPSFDTFYEGKFVLVKGAIEIGLEELRSDFPFELLNRRSGVIGTPEAFDGGGFYLEYQESGIRKFWIIDRNKKTLPRYLHDYVDQMNIVLEKAVFLNQEL